MPAKDLSVLIPARQEKYLARTIQNVIECAEMDTEVIAVLDGYLPDPPISADSSKFRWLYFEESIGQRAATNRAAEYSEAKYVMKLDAHSAVDQGFDRKLIEPYESGEIGMDVTTIPGMYYLHVFDWVCDKCAARYYQADPVETCVCGNATFHEEMVWKPRLEKGLVCFGRFDSTLHWQYWPRYTRRRPEAEKAEIADTMSAVGACFFMPRQRFFDIDGLDEKHGSWGQYGAEVSCKSWLSGGRQVVNKRTWYAHYFRVGKTGGFPYPISGDAQERAKVYSRDLWINNKWAKQTRPLSWLVDHFWPVRGWDNAEAKEALEQVRKAGEEFNESHSKGEL
jgi:glycosyltransferase involved in cell wall biosynthesis